MGGAERMHRRPRAALCAWRRLRRRLDVHAPQALSHVAKAVGCRALIVHYRRAPENIHPGPVNDMARNYKWLLDQSIRPNHIALIDDSAAGSLALTIILRARELGVPMSAATMPLSP